MLNTIWLMEEMANIRSVIAHRFSLLGSCGEENGLAPFHSLLASDWTQLAQIPELGRRRWRPGRREPKSVAAD